MAVVATPQVVDPPTRQPRSSRLVAAAPELVVSAVAGFALPAMVLLLAGHFSPGWVFPFGLAGAVAAVMVCGLGSERVDRRVVLCTRCRCRDRRRLARRQFVLLRRELLRAPGSGDV